MNPGLASMELRRAARLGGGSVRSSTRIAGIVAIVGGGVCIALSAWCLLQARHDAGAVRLKLGEFAKLQQEQLSLEWIEAMKAQGKLPQVLGTDDAREHTASRLARTGDELKLLVAHRRRFQAAGWVFGGLGAVSLLYVVATVIWWRIRTPESIESLSLKG